MVCPRGAVADFGMGPRLTANKQNVPTSPPVPLGSAEKEQHLQAWDQSTSDLISSADLSLQL